ncbi:MAG: Gfo/Idh/MocA family oxidoreductase [Verrucomicrobia bacterium]|nr:Gfo/Idh/MocA family oxidoreductase [Verrucomicrobiota bacterium]
MHRPIKWGVIGSTGIAQRRTIPEGLVPAQNARLVAVYSRRAAANAAVAARYGARAAGSVAALLADEVEAVYVASPPDAHLDHVRACARAGKHVLCEKPLGRTVAEAEAMVAECGRAGVRLGTAFMMRFQAQHCAALDLWRAGALGRPVLGRAQLSCWYPPQRGAWRQDPHQGGGGSLIDMGGHCLDLLEMFFGSIRSVSCCVNRTVHDYASEDSAVVTVRFANGALGVVDAFFCIPDVASENRLELYGSRGSILARGTIGQGELGDMTAYLTESGGDYDSQQERVLGGQRAIQPAPVNTYRAEIEAFGQAILEGRDRVPGADLGLRSQQVLAACYESDRTGRSISIDSAAGRPPAEP